MGITLPWFPPAPAPGPASILSLPPDDWVMQPKIDGIRVIIYRGEPFTRLGPSLSKSKGAALLRSMFKGRDETLDGEWVQKEGKYYVFDLPDHPGDLDDRFRALCRIAIFKVPGVALLESYGGHFARIYGTLPREGTEGVVFKRRAGPYAKQRRPSTEVRNWLKRRFVWDQPKP